MVLNLDIAPTLMELAGLPRLPAMQGRSLQPIFAGLPAEWRRSFLIEYFSDTVYPRIFKMGYSAVRTERHKYIEYRELQGMNELYDLQADPYEERNLIGTPAAASVEADLQRELQKLLTDTNAGS